MFIKISLDDLKTQCGQIKAASLTFPMVVLQKKPYNLVSEMPLFFWANNGNLEVFPV